MIQRRFKRNVNTATLLMAQTLCRRAALLRLGRSCKHDTPRFHHHCFSASNVTSEGGHRRNSRGECLRVKRHRQHSVFSKTKKPGGPTPPCLYIHPPRVCWTWTEEDFTKNSLPEIGNKKSHHPLTCSLTVSKSGAGGRKPFCSPATYSARGFAATGIPIFSCLGPKK